MELAGNAQSGEPLTAQLPACQPTPGARRLGAPSLPGVTVLLLLLLLALAAPATAQTDLDALMERVLENREESWRQLQGLLLSEREELSVTGPDLRRLFGMEREHVWVARDGKAVRHPVRVNGVAVSDTSEDDDEHEEATLGKFMRFPFDPGNYYLVGRETLAGVEVLRIEYYPTRMYEDDEDEDKDDDKDEAGEGRRVRPDDEIDEGDAMERRLNFAFNKVTRVTLWVDAAQQRMVKATFENVDFSFLPGRSLVRVEQARATMEMGQPFAGVWLPVQTTVEGAATLATGTYSVTYRRDYFDYRQTDVRMRFRVGGFDP